MGTSPPVARTLAIVPGGRLAALLLAAFAGVGCGADPLPPPVLLIAVEGLETSLLEELLATGELPNIQRLVDRGSLAEIRSPLPAPAPAVWTTVATGVPSSAHGIDGFLVDGVPARSTQRRAPALWNLLPRIGVATAVVGWPATWPAEPDSGLMVSDRAHLEPEGRMEPEGLVSMAARRIRAKPPIDLDRFTTFALDLGYDALLPDDPGYRLHYLVDRRLNRTFQRDRLYVGIALELLAAHPVDVLALGIRGVDTVSHGFWAFRRSGGARRGRTDPRTAALAEVIPAYYRYLDDVVGQLVRAARREPLVLLIGDHGAGPARAVQPGLFVSGAHREVAALIVSGPGAQTGALQTRPITHEDILPTLLWVTGRPQAGDLPGRPLREYLSERYAASESIPAVASYRDALDAIAVAPRQTPDSVSDPEVLEELESLGHLDR
jgi:hypothetical protein